MSKYIICCFFFSFFCLYTIKSTAQLPECGVIDSRNELFQRQHLSKFTEEHNQNNIHRNSTTIVPLSIHIVAEDDGTGGLSETVVDDAIAEANIHFASTNIQFQKCDSEVIHSSAYYILSSKDEGDNLSAAYNHSNVVNIYFVENANGSCGWARFPWVNKDYVMMDNDCADNGSTFSHELGHYFGLWHTHSSSNGAELVDGTNCLVAGDLACDTPADPNISGLVNTDCNYTGTATDANGDAYVPDPSNLMSYSRKSCRDYLSAEQIAFINYYAANERDYLFCHTGNLPDVFVKNMEAPTTAMPGDDISVSCRHRYSGGGTNILLRLEYYLSSDDQWDASDVLLGDDLSGISALDTYDGESETLTIPATTPIGHYYLLFVADAEGDLSETREDNNVSSLPISIGVPLPVELSSFTGRIDGKKNMLDWTTASEIQNSHFEVQRSIDGRQFETIGTVEGHGTSSEEQVYRFADKSPIQLAYYRLKQVDFDGGYDYSDIILLERELQGLLVNSIYPSPTKNTASIHISATEANIGNLSIVDVTGKVLKQQKLSIKVGENTPKVDISDLAAGVYFFQLDFGQQRDVLRVLKE